MKEEKVGLFIHDEIQKPFTSYYKLKSGRIRIKIEPGRLGKKYGLKPKFITVEEEAIIQYPKE